MLHLTIRVTSNASNRAGVLVRVQGRRLGLALTWECHVVGNGSVRLEKRSN